MTTKSAGSPAPRRRVFKRLAAGAGALMLLATATGFIYQSGGERRDLRLHPAPGRLVAVGGHRLHIHCVGSGQPTVILEAGLGNDVNHWSRVQPEIAQVARVCSYDRAGLGWSEAGPLPRTAERIVQELALLLEAAGEAPPWVLAGHSNGGTYVRLFAAAHPEKVQGLVLVDPNPEVIEPCERLPAATQALYGGVVALSPLGLPRLLLPSLFPLDQTPLPEEAREAHGSLRARTSALRALWSEWNSTCAMQESVRASAPLPAELPIVLISAGQRPAAQVPVVADAHRAMVRQWPAGELVIAERSAHWVQLDDPLLVADAVRRVLHAGAGTR
jgi:pimeloyl-ACP methyl ester carboxylesterase